MNTSDSELWSDEEDNSGQEANQQPSAYRVDDESNIEEKDLKTHYLFGEGKMKDPSAPGMEGQGMGGEKFGQNNLTPSGDDKANPSRNAGYDNAYFRRTQPAEEHPEDSNFKVQDQNGEPAVNKGKPNIPGPNELPDQQKVGEGTNKDHPKPQQNYTEGTADNDGQKHNGPKSSEDNAAGDIEKRHTET